MSDRQAIFVVKSNSLGTEINYEFVLLLLLLFYKLDEK